MNQNSVLKFSFPLEKCQNGIPMGNSLLGLLVFGKNNRLNLTVGCEDLWDHQGIKPAWRNGMTYRAIRKAAETADRAAMRRIYRMDAREADPDFANGQRPPAVRIVLHLPSGSQLQYGELHLNDAGCRIHYLDGSKQKKQIDIRMDMNDLHHFVLADMDGIKVEMKPSFRLCSALRRHGYREPIEEKIPDGTAFVQPLPLVDDPAYGFIFQRKAGCVHIGYERGGTPKETLRQLKTRSFVSFREVKDNNAAWWNRYWKKVPRVSLGNAPLDNLYWFGAYKFGAMTAPEGVPAGLQGIWLNDDSLPPFRSNYHLNVNVQMCYAPALKLNHPEHLRRLFDFILSWRNIFRENARKFLGISDGYMTGHMLNDRGEQGYTSYYWPGMIDPGCGAWIALMMFEYCDYTDDRKFLRNQVMDFARGIMRVYEVLLECREDGSFELPFSVSPEYREGEYNDWGKNSSFQLAAIHAVIHELLRSCELLGQSPEPIWKKIGKHLPQAAIVEKDGHKEIGVWNNVSLEKSHRHHSHLAGIHPFGTIDPDSPAWREICKYSIERLAICGTGFWGNFSFPWASCLMTRMGYPDASEVYLELWERLFASSSGGSLCDLRNCRGVLSCDFVRKSEGSLMQMDGQMGAVAAICEMFLFARNGILYVGRGIPKSRPLASCSGMQAPGGFLVDAVIRNGEPVTVSIRATRKTILKLQLVGERMIVRNMVPGEVFSWKTTNQEQTTPPVVGILRQ